MKRLLLVGAVILSLAGASALSADEFAQWARGIHAKHQKAVVTAQLVIKSKLSMSGGQARTSETRQEVTGTVVDPSGLIVVSLSAIDPGQLVENLMSDDRIKMESELADVKILAPDGEELPAEVVLRDKDMDLAFLRLKTKPASPMTFINMAESGKAELLDPVVALNRMGNAAGRSYSASAERISAVIQRPRLLYIPDSNVTSTALGSPAFTADGKVLGIVVMRAIKGSTSSGGLGGQNQNYLSVIIPAADVLKAAKQVPASEKAEK